MPTCIQINVFFLNLHIGCTEQLVVINIALIKLPTNVFSAMLHGNLKSEINFKLTQNKLNSTRFYQYLLV